MEKKCKNGICTSCGGTVAWVWDPSGRWRLFDTGPEHDCPEGGYSPRRLQPRHRPVEPMLRKLIAAAMASENGLGA